MPEPGTKGYPLPTRGWAAALSVAAVGLTAGLTAGLRFHTPGLQQQAGVQVFRSSGVQGTTTDERPTIGDQQPASGHLNTRAPEHLNTRPLTASAPSPLQPLPGVTAIARTAEASRWVRAVGVAVYDLRRDESFGVRPNRIFPPASVIKLAVMVGAFQAREDGAIPPVRFERLRPYLRRMITISDNPSATYLVRVLGHERVNRAMAQAGFRYTHLALRPERGGALVGSTATPAEVARLLAMLARRELVSPQASNEMLLLLGASKRRTRIPAGLPSHAGLWVGNKTGTLAGLVHDSAIVLDPERGIGYTLAIFTQGARSEAAGQRLCIAISRAVYTAMSRLPAQPQAALPLGD